jgi:anhydro-N-acetylmuramic acid kinase
MSGTSLDGETDGERIDHFGPTGYRPYSDDEQALLRQALQEGAALTDRAARPGVVAQADVLVTRVHAETVEAFLATENIEKSGVAIVGFHGQTVLHRPAARLTVQIGDGAALARRRCRRRRTGRTAGAGVPSSAGARSQATTSNCGAQCRRYR